jgi:hypothetical protein
MLVKQNDYGWDSLAERLRRFYETPAPVPKRCARTKRDWLIFQHNVKKLSDEDLFLLCYVEEMDGNTRQCDLFGHEITARGFSYGDYTAFLKAKGLPAIAGTALEEPKASDTPKTVSKRSAA